MAHKERCQRIAFNAHKKSRTAPLAVIYDKRSRMKWAERSMQDVEFSANAVAGMLDEEVLRDAEEEYDAEKGQPNSYSKHATESQATRKCYNCGKVCSVSVDCAIN